MNKLGIVFAALAAGGMVCAMPASAAGGKDAERLRRLDIMLMVTSLRCRTTPDNFQPEFQRFEAAHLGTLNEAAGELRNGLVTEYGVTGATRALDRLSTTMANQYGQGHPWLGCAELKVATRILTSIRGRDALSEAADQLLAPDARGEFALAGR
jgi:hypothetical protein